MCSIRGAGLADSMSRYLIRRIEDSPKVTLRTRTNIEALEGTDRLERLRWRTTGDGDSETAFHRTSVSDDGRRSQYGVGTGMRGHG